MTQTLLPIAPLWVKCLIGVGCCSCGGNLLMNVGPTHDGRILPIFEERLREMGSWLQVNGEAIYASKPWAHQNDTVTKRVWYTMKDDAVYPFALDWPVDNNLLLGAPVTSTNTVVTLLGYEGGSLKWSPGEKSAGIVIQIPPIGFNEMPCNWTLVFKLTNVRGGQKVPRVVPDWMVKDHHLEDAQIIEYLFVSERSSFDESPLILVFGNILLVIICLCC